MNDIFLKDPQSETILAHADRLPEAAELLAAMRAEPTARFAVRGLTGSARGYFTAWLTRHIGRPVLYLTAHGEVYEQALDDLEYFLGRGDTLAFPEPETLPYDPSSPHPGLIAQRLETLTRLAALRSPGIAAQADGELAHPSRACVVIATVRSLLQRVPAPARLEAAMLRLRVGYDYDPAQLMERLVYLGYERLPEVEAVGHFARRGGILDVFPVGLTDPLRLEFDGDTLSSLRRFDANTQRSLEQLTGATVPPRFEVVVMPEEAEAVAERLRAAGDERARAGAFLFHEGMERFAGHYDASMGSLLDYLPPETVVLVDDPGALNERVRALEEEIARGFEETRAHYPLVSPPQHLFLAASALGGALQTHGGVDWMGAIQDAAQERYRRSWTIECSPPEPVQRSMERLKTHLAELAANGYRVLVLCDNPGQRERLEELLGPKQATLAVGLLSAGFTLRGARLALLTDHEIFARYRRRRRRLRKTGGLTLAELSALRLGDYVVHEDHGVGVYRGLKRLTLNGQETDCMEVGYAEGDRLFVPVHQLVLVSRYAAEDGARPAVHRLGSAQWQKTKARARKAIAELAEGLIRAYAARAALPGHAFPADTVWQREMEASFLYEETPDQLAAIEAVKEDMESGRPMDRLICGDVGYGKTEVAIRAAFKCVQDGKQVAVLVPTTILAQQHLQTFTERLADYPVKVEVLSRFRTAAQQEKVVAGLKSGDVDVVIGTHRLLSKDVGFKDLGLVVIDEEHRFGVAHKERLRQMRGQVEVMALSATPIPRTLNLSLAGARDISVIETPPKDRLPIHTEILEWDDDVVADAVLREVDRGGQVFYVHNRIETLDNAKLLVQKLVPQVRVAAAHGQLPERRLERVMADFLDRRYDVLVSTMIIESGLDIPSVNTLIVDRADTLGLAQLYQLRGRVGRSHHRAYAYLLVPSRRVLTEDAEKRLRVIEEFDELGAGFKIALKDLEIRGAGNLLGGEQHGFIVGLGFDLYCKLLEEEVTRIKGQAAEVKPEPRLVTDWSAYLPDDYVPDEHEKLLLYRRLAETKDLLALDDLILELMDRFGQLPPPAVALVELRRLRLLGLDADVVSLRVFQRQAELTLRGPLRPQQIRALVGGLSFTVEFWSGREFGLRARGEGLALLHRTREVLQALGTWTKVAA